MTDQLPKPDLVAVPPLENAWRRFLTVTERSRIDQTTGQLLAASEPDQMELVVLNTSFHSLIRNPDFCRNLNLGPDWFGLTFPRYAPPRVNVGREEDFDLRCEVMVNVPPPTTPPLLPHMTQAGSRGSFGTASGPRGELVCLFVFEVRGPFALEMAETSTC